MTLAAFVRLPYLDSQSQDGSNATTPGFSLLLPLQRASSTNIPKPQSTQLLQVLSPLLSPCTMPQCLIVLIVLQRLHSSSAIIQAFVPCWGAEGIKQREDNGKLDTEGQMTSSL